MSARGLRPSDRIGESDWVAPRLRRFGSCVAAIVPDSFPAYVRILHPARGGNDVARSWADVAAWSGRTMHRLVQFHRITQPLLGSEPWDGAGPEPGNLPIERLRVLCATLAGHTGTPQACWFCLWEGYGWLHAGATSSVVSYREREPGAGREPNVPVPPALALAALHKSRVRLPKRNYLLFDGPLSAAAQLGCEVGGGFLFPQSPNLFWPQDRAWCVASEIDLFCTLVAGSESLAEALMSEPLLETYRVNPEDPICHDSDRINP